MLSCGMVPFPTGHYWQCSWPVKKGSPGMCLWKWWTFWTFLWTNSCKQLPLFMCFWFKWLLSIVLAFYCVDAWWSIGLPCLGNCKALSLLRTVKEQNVNVAILHGINLCTYSNDIWPGVSFICWIADIKSHLKHVLRAWKVQNLWF